MGRLFLTVLIIVSSLYGQKDLPTVAVLDSKDHSINEFDGINDFINIDSFDLIWITIN